MDDNIKKYTESDSDTTYLKDGSSASNNYGYGGNHQNKIICKRCGAELADGVGFCKNCGTFISKSDSNNMNYNNFGGGSPRNMPQNRDDIHTGNYSISDNRNNMFTILLAVLITVAIAVAVVIILVVAKQDSSSDSIQSTGSSSTQVVDSSNSGNSNSSGNNGSAAAENPQTSPPVPPQQPSGTQMTSVDRYRDNLTYKSMEYIHSSYPVSYEHKRVLSNFVNNFDIACENYINYGNDEALYYLRSGSRAYNQQKAFKEKGEVVWQTYENVEYYDLRYSNGYYYFWVEEVMKYVHKGGRTEIISENWVYQIRDEGGKLYIEDYTRDPLYN